MKVLFICYKGQSTFIEPIHKHVSESSLLIIDNTTTLEKISDDIHNHDIVFLEWANDLSCQITHHFSNLLRNKKVIVRCHSFEVLNGMVTRLNFKIVNEIIFVGKYIHDFIIKKIPSHIRTHIIPNGIKVDDFDLNSNGKSSKIAYLGYISHKKGPMLFSQLADNFPEYEFHMGGIFQDIRYKAYINYQKSKGRCKNIRYDGLIKDKKKWFSDKKFILCTSPWESQNLSIMEGMASGLKPLVHDFPGSEQIYPKWAIWWNTCDFENLLKGPYEPQKYRSFISKVYNFETTTRRLREIVFFINDSRLLEAKQ